MDNKKERACGSVALGHGAKHVHQWWGGTFEDSLEQNLIQPVQVARLATHVNEHEDGLLVALARQPHTLHHLRTAPGGTQSCPRQAPFRFRLPVSSIGIDRKCNSAKI